MSDLSDFQGSAFNSSKTKVSKTLSNNRNDSGDVTGMVGLELPDLEHTITDNVQSVVIVGSIEAYLQGTNAKHMLNCWRNEIPTASGDTYDHTNLVASVVIHTSVSQTTKTVNFGFVDNNVGDSTAMKYKWTIKTTTGNSQNRNITLHYLTNPFWDLRNN